MSRFNDRFAEKRLTRIASSVVIYMEQDKFVDGEAVSKEISSKVGEEYGHIDRPLIDSHLDLFYPKSLGEAKAKELIDACFLHDAMHLNNEINNLEIKNADEWIKALDEEEADDTGYWADTAFEHSEAYRRKMWDLANKVTGAEPNYSVDGFNITIKGLNEVTE